MIGNGIENTRQDSESPEKALPTSTWEPEFRLKLLYDKIYREDILIDAYRLAKANRAPADTNGATVDQVASESVTKWLTKIKEPLRIEIYRPLPVRRVRIPKPGGGERPLASPPYEIGWFTLATKLVVEPIFEADLEPHVYGYRPQAHCVGKIQKVQEQLKQGYTGLVDAYLSEYFDTIPHQALMPWVSRRLVERNVPR